MGICEMGIGYMGIICIYLRNGHLGYSHANIYSYIMAGTSCGSGLSCQEFKHSFPEKRTSLPPSRKFNNQDHIFLVLNIT